MVSRMAASRGRHSSRCWLASAASGADQGHLLAPLLRSRAAHSSQSASSSSNTRSDGRIPSLRLQTRSFATKPARSSKALQKEMFNARVGKAGRIDDPALRHRGRKYVLQEKFREEGTANALYKESHDEEWESYLRLERDDEEGLVRDQHEQWVVRDTKVISQRAKTIINDLHQRDPLIWTAEKLSATFGISATSMAELLEQGGRSAASARKGERVDYSIARLLEAKYGTDDIVETKAFLLHHRLTDQAAFLEQVPKHQFFKTIGDKTSLGPRALPKLEAEDKTPIVEGFGSGTPVEGIERIPELESDFLVIDMSHPRRVRKQRQAPVWVREKDGSMRYSTEREMMYVRDRYFHSQKPRTQPMTKPRALSEDGRKKHQLLAYRTREDKETLTVNEELLDKVA